VLESGKGIMPGGIQDNQRGKASEGLQPERSDLEGGWLCDGQHF